MSISSTIDAQAIDKKLATICQRAAELERQFADELAAVHPKFTDSAKNLIHYVALRQFDIRELQDQLVTLGLSSLGRAEPHVLPNLLAVRRALQSLHGQDTPHPAMLPEPFRLNRRRLEQHTDDLLGPEPAAREVRIMVTLPADAATDYTLVRGMIDAGMNVARINAAHDGRDAWRAMIDNVEHACRELDRECRIVMDLAGPKFRTGEFTPKLRHKGIVLQVGDRLLLDRSPLPGEAATSDGDAGQPAHVSLIPPEILDDVAVGDRVSLNDGKIEGVVQEIGDRGLTVTIIAAKTKGSRLRAHRGVNFPDSNLECPSLTQADLGNIGFVAGHADAVSQSFVRDPEDVVALQDELQDTRNDKLGLITKIETQRAFEQLPKVLLKTMRHYPAGIMIARGDLAVECGWVRLAVMQEEILWLCEAAHLPVIWATQVLEGKTKTGLPSRAEITDAAMSQRADCVMLNKGPHILSAIRMLDDILRRMQHHQHKKSARLPRLRIMNV